MTLKIQKNYPLKAHTTLGVGGAAQMYIEVADFYELQQFLQENKGPIFVLGNGSNVLIRDGGIDGVVLKLKGDFKTIQVLGNRLICGAGVSLSKVAQVAMENDLGGFEFLADIPGTLGGGLPTNAGAFGKKLSDVLVSLDALDRDGHEKHFDDFSQWSYRFCPLENLIFTGAVLRAKESKPKSEIKALQQVYRDKRKATQPWGVRTAGSTFKNPKEQSAGFLIEKVGLKGYKGNGCEMSAKHANFLVNVSASANELEEFIQFVADKVLMATGIYLEREIKCIGKR